MTIAAMSPGLRWLLFGGVSILIIGLLIGLERAVSILLLVLIVVICTGLLLNQAYAWFVRQYVRQEPHPTPVSEFIAAQRVAVTHMLAVSGVFVLMLSGYHFAPAASRDALPLATLLLLVGGYLLGTALALAPAWNSDWPPSAQVLQPVHTRWHRLLALGGVVCLALLAEYNGQLLQTGLVLSTHLQFGLWALGISLIVIGLGGMTPHRPRLIALTRRELAPLLVILLLALGLRLWNLENSARFLVDELDFTGAILTLATETERPLLKPVSELGGFSLLFPYVQFHTVKVFGHNFTGLRIASTLIGTLHIVALYALARQLFDRPTAIMAALLLATFPPHVHFSRLGLTELPGAVCGTAGLALLTRALLQGRRADYVLAGALLGMTHYFHEGGRLLYTPLAFTWLAGLWWLGWVRVSGRNLGWLVLTLVLVALPNYYALYGLGFPLTNRLATTNVAIDALYFDEIRASGEPVRLLRERIVDPLLLFTHHIDGALFYMGSTGLVLPVLIPLFLSGLWVVIWRWRQPGALLLLIWLAATIAGNSLLLVSTSVARYVIVFAAIALVMAVGLRCFSRLILPPQLLSAKLYRAVVVGLVVTLAVAQVYYYFGEHIPTHNEQARDLWGFSDSQDAVARSVDFPDGSAIHIIGRVPPPTDYVAGLLAFLAPDKQFMLDFPTAEAINADYLAALDVSIDHAFFIEPAESAVLDTISRYFYLLPPEYTPYPYIAREYQFVLYYAPYIRGYSESRAEEAQAEPDAAAP